VVLRGILSPLGEEGAAAIHSVLRKCGNYSKNLTNKMISVDVRKPIGCARIKEILSYMVDRVDCDCRFRKTKNDYAHPLRHLRASAHKDETKTISQCPKEPAAPKRATATNNKKCVSIDETKEADDSIDSLEHYDISTSSHQSVAKSASPDSYPLISMRISIGPVKFSMKLTHFFRKKMKKRN
jgi:hypothetical protein